MAYLNLQAIVSNSTARTGTVDPVEATVSVTDSTGTPVTTLSRADFIVGNTWGPFRIQVISFQHVGPDWPWGYKCRRSIYDETDTNNRRGLDNNEPLHLVFVVDTGKDHGQTIAELSFS